MEAQETGEEVILMKDKDGRGIGVEKWNFKPSTADPVRRVFEAFEV